MKNNRMLRPFLRLFLILIVCLVIAAGAGIGLFYYVFAIPEPEGLSLASWPDRFTDNFNAWLGNENGVVHVKESGFKQLDEYGLWLQVIDESGQQVLAYHKPETYPESYRASELLAIDTSRYENGNTVFVGSYEDSGRTWSYLIGFPYAVGKYVMYYNGGNVARLSPVFRTVILCVLVVILLAAFGYMFWLTRQLGKIASGMSAVADHSYEPLKETGIFSGIYRALNHMDQEIRDSDKMKKETDQARREWITNITHDLKTPLSPAKGYAELLAGTDETESRTAREYGAIILKNIDHIEKLINDLKLTYQLDSGAAPFHPRQVQLTRYLRELMIDIVNTPQFSERDIAFESGTPEMEATLDPELFRRAVWNLVINALVHNPPDTKVVLAVGEGADGSIRISVRDDGTGMSEAEQERVFDRYYRGTNTKESPEGTGLGLAIVRQIVLLHGGTITVRSGTGEGTEFTILLPAVDRQSGEN